jgi:hypothetical protein
MKKHIPTRLPGGLAADDGGPDLVSRRRWSGPPVSRPGSSARSSSANRLPVGQVLEVPGGDGYRAVAEQQADGRDRRAGALQFGGERVPQAVRVDPLADVGRGGQAPQHAAHVVVGDRAAGQGAEQAAAPIQSSSVDGAG